MTDSFTYADAGVNIEKANKKALDILENSSKGILP